MRRTTAAVSILLTAGIAIGAAVALAEPAASISRELRDAAADASNHTPYADLVRAELASRGKLQTMTATMGCFWAGEGQFGLMPGVFRTSPGYEGRREVVRVEFDPSVISADELMSPPTDLLDTRIAPACQLRPAPPNPTGDDRFRPDDQPKFYLQQTELRFVPMTPAQVTRINALLHVHRPFEPLLAPAQLSRLAHVRAHPDWAWKNYVDDPQMERWESDSRRTH